MTIYKTEYFLIIENCNEVIKNIVLKYFKKESKDPGDFNLQTDNLHNTYIYIGLYGAEMPEIGQYLGFKNSSFLQLGNEKQKINLQQFLEEIFRLKRELK